MLRLLKIPAYLLAGPFLLVALLFFLLKSEWEKLGEMEWPWEGLK